MTEEQVIGQKKIILSNRQQLTFKVVLEKK